MNLLGQGELMVDYVISDFRQTTLTLSSGDTATVDATGSITGGTGRHGISGQAGAVTVWGSVSGVDGGHGFNSFGTSGTVTIGATGTISGSSALKFNDGGNYSIQNAGAIKGVRYGIDAGAGVLSVVNTGVIEGGPLGAGAAIFAGGGQTDTIVNAGLVKGSIALAGGNDIYQGRDGFVTSVIFLDLGNDEAYGGAGTEIIHGGYGDDIIDGGGASDTAVFSMDWPGTSPDATATVDLRITERQDTGNGQDTLVSIENLTAWFGNYRFVGSAAANLLAGGFGRDTLEGGAGNDTLFGALGDDVIDGGEGFDTVIFEAPASSADYLSNNVGATVNLADPNSHGTGYGSDRFLNVEALVGTALKDNFSGNAEANTFDGGLGDDSLSGAGGNDTLLQQVQDGDDVLVGGDGTDTVVFSGSAAATVNLALATAQGTGYGTDTLSGIENLIGGSGADVFFGNALANVFSGNEGSDRLVGSTGNDTLSGGAANDALAGGSHNDRLYGDAGSDTLTGDSGSDVLFGGDGGDTLVGGLGNDTLAGGTEADVFVFATRLNKKTNLDRITDFDVTKDLFRLDNAVFTALKNTGVLSKGAFCVGATAQDSGDRIVYNRTTGALSYDSDGTGAAAQVQFATIGKKLALSAADFVIF
jgi:Ca2+-binding RTX toxin-like protein